MSKRRRDDSPTCASDGTVQFAECEDRKELVRMVSCWLQDMVRYYDSLEWTIGANGLQRTNVFPVSAFHGRPLSSSIERFIHTICSGAKLDDSVIIVAAVYMSRIIEKAGGELPVSSCTVHRLLLLALTVGAKFVLDHPRSNKVMASFADLPISKFNQLEVRFLCAIQYNLAVSPADIEIAKNALCCTPLSCDAGECKRIKTEVYDKCNESSSASGSEGLAAYNNLSESDGEECNNYKQLAVAEEETAKCKTITSDVPLRDLAANNYTADTNECSKTHTEHCVVSAEPFAASPKWSQVPSPGGSTASTQVPLRSDLICADTKTSAMNGTPCSMLPQPTKLSTPERRGKYALVAIAAE